MADITICRAGCSSVDGCQGRGHCEPQSHQCECMWSDTIGRYYCRQVEGCQQVPLDMNLRGG